jgi:DNA-directed RNA polymerase specialized sigma24 family protein
MGYADKVWGRNSSRIGSIIGGIAHGYGLDETFKREAHNKFYENFERYYEDDDGYLKFFYSCLINMAKNRVKTKSRDTRNVSVVTGEDGEDTSIYDMMSVEDNSMQEQLFINEINDIMKSTLDEVEYFVYQHLLEGWTPCEIRKMIGVSSTEIFEIKNIIGKKLKGYLK